MHLNYQQRNKGLKRMDKEDYIRKAEDPVNYLYIN